MEEQLVLDPTYTENGELRGIPPEVAFILGVEWATFRLLLDADPYSPMNIDIHRENVERVSALCQSRGRLVTSEDLVSDPMWVAVCVLPVARRTLRLVSG